MNKIIYSLLLAVTLLPAGINAKKVAATYKSDITVDVASVQRVNRNLNIDLLVNLDNTKMNQNREVVYTPMLQNGNDSVEFQSFTVAGRNRYYRAIRNGQESPMLFQAGKDNGVLNYSVTTPYQPWMEEATLVVKATERGCSNCKKEENEYILGYTDFVPRTYTPEFIYVTPIAEAVKTRSVNGRAFIDFVVNKTVIDPQYRRNPAELRKIVATIDSVKNDKDITVTALSIRGTASPEGSYANNERLAKGRTEALVDYVQNLYRFPRGFIKTSWLAEDWPGLREWVENSTIENREGILAIIDGPLEEDAKNTKIQTTYPKQYRWLLENVYPGLRHSDYNIDFEIRTFTQPEEILEIMTTAPQKLSLAELFTAARSQPEGSDLYNEAFEIAVKMFPTDEVANLNAGISAMNRQDFVTAKRYLNNAGERDEAQYARAVLSALEGDKQAALAQFKRLALNPGSPVAESAAAAAASLEAILNADGQTFRVAE